jgi:NADPH-dependent 2,4-dienoyl-CoA reductase/sulfur reductase-like enzyme
MGYEGKRNKEQSIPPIGCKGAALSDGKLIVRAIAEPAAVQSKAGPIFGGARMKKAINGFNGMKGEQGTANHIGQHAAVIGGSLAGLMTARVLADHLDTVTVLERDRIEEGPTLVSPCHRGAMSMGCCWVGST